MNVDVCMISAHDSLATSTYVIYTPPVSFLRQYGNRSMQDRVWRRLPMQTKLCKQNNIICMIPFRRREKIIEPFVLSHLPTFLAPGGTGRLARDGEIWLIPTLEQEAYFRREHFRHEPMSMLSAHLHRRQAPPPSRPRDDDDYEEEEEEEEEGDDSSADEVEQQRIIRWVKNLRKVSTFRDTKRLVEVVWGADVRGIQYRYRNKRVGARRLLCSDRR